MDDVRDDRGVYRNPLDGTIAGIDFNTLNEFISDRGRSPECGSCSGGKLTIPTIDQPDGSKMTPTVAPLRTRIVSPDYGPPSFYSFCGNCGLVSYTDANVVLKWLAERSLPDGR